jgi:hypothetical protein
MGVITVLWDVTLQFGGQAAVTERPLPISAHSSFTNIPISYCPLPLLCTFIPTKLTSALKVGVACSLAALLLPILLHGIAPQKTQYFVNIH